MYDEERYGNVTVLRARNGGVLPYGNSVVVHGSSGTIVIDPSLALDRDPVGADAVLISHAHEDHIAGLKHFTADTYAHTADAPAVGSFDAMLAQYGIGPDIYDEMARHVRTEYGIPDRRSDVHAIDDGHVFDLGDRTATLIHLPGHTPGHSGLLIEPDGFLYVADIDLTSFGPMYADVESSIDDYLSSLDIVAGIDARWYGTFHHKGVIDGSDDFRTRVHAYRDKLFSREDRLLEYLSEPRTLDDIAAYRLVYRPHVEAPYVDAVERRTAELHLQRLLRAEQISVDPDARYARV